MKSKEKFYATGRRKTSIARVYVSSGTGKIMVNGKDLKEYLVRDTLTMLVCQPLESISVREKYDIIARLNGGGLSGQAGALRNGIAKALVEIDYNYRKILKEGGFLTRDSRKKERKKYGHKGARRSFQFSKR